MQPDLILTPFGNSATGGAISPIPETRDPGDPQNKATWEDGFPSITMTPIINGGIPPRGQDVNGVLKAISEQAVYTGGGGQYQWSAAYVAKNGGYPKGAVLQSNDGLSSYVSLVNDNAADFNVTPASIGVSWAVYAGASAPSVVDFMSPAQKADFFAQTSLVDQTSALSAFWQYIKSTFVDVPSEDYVKVAGKIPAGEYRIDGSVNFTNIKARNTIVEANGAVFIGRGASNNTVDMTGTRWLQIYGLTILGDAVDPPKCGLLMGPQGIETSGNNLFWGVNVTGYFLRTAVWNIGSETTTWFRGRIVNYNQDPTAKAYIGDGRMRNGATSAYAALRAFGVAVSFTNNQFYSADIRNVGGGACTWLEFTRGWVFDAGCYNLSYNDANFEIWQTATSVHQNLSVGGLMETSFQNQPVPGNTGCKYQIKFLGDGTASELEGLNFKVGVPHAAVASIYQDPTSGVLAVTNADITVGHQLTVGIPVFDAPRLTLTGHIKSANATELNIDDIVAFSGFIISSGAGAVRPAAGAYVEINSSSGQILLGGSGPRTYDGVYRAEGAATDVAFKGRGKGAGGAELGNEALINALQVLAALGAVNGLIVRASAAGTGVRLESFGADANVSVIIAPKGAGYIINPVANVPNFADDTAAAAGGLPIGAHYRTGSALKIRVA